MEKCEQFIDDIYLYVDNALDKKALANLNAHLENCPDCRKELEEIQTLVMDLNKMGELPLPDGLHDKVMKKIELINDPIQFITKTKPKIGAFKPINTSLKQFPLISATFVAGIFIVAFALSSINQSISEANKPSNFESADKPVPMARGVAEEIDSGLNEGIALMSDSAIPEYQNITQITSGANEEKKVDAPLTVNDYTVKEFHITIEVSDYDNAIEVINSFSGYSTNQNIQYGDEESYKSASITRRVPISDYGSYKNLLRSLGKVTGEYEYQKQTANYIFDNQVRLTAKNQEADRLKSLLEKSQSVGVLVQVESRLSNIEMDKSNLETEILTANDQITMPYLYIDIFYTPEPTVTIDTQPLTIKMVNSFKTSVVSILSVFEVLLIGASGLTIPVIVFAALSFFAIYLVRLFNKAKRRENHEK